MYIAIICYSCIAKLCLLRLISRLVRQVVQEDHEELQYELVIKLAERREQLRHVSVWLDRPGAV